MVNDIRRYMNLFEDQNENNLQTVLEEYFAVGGKISRNGNLFDVDGAVQGLSYKKCNHLPFKFGKVNGNFEYVENHLISLIGSPFEVRYDFDCRNNYLISLKGAPVSVGENFCCSHNKLTTLVGCPQHIGGAFLCDDNPLVSLEGCPIPDKNSTNYISLTWHKDLPLLRLLNYTYIMFDDVNFKENNEVYEILTKYCGDASRNNILKCQRELIDAGYEGNAGW